MRSSQVLTAALAFSSISAAFSWSDPLRDTKALQGFDTLFHKRQNDEPPAEDPPAEDPPAEDPPADEEPAPEEEEPTPAQDEEPQPDESGDPEAEPTDDQPAESSGSEGDEEPSRTGDEEDGPRETGEPSGTGERGPSRTTARPTKSANFDPRLPAGGISMQTPGSLAAPHLFKIGDYVTFGWNYTSLSVTPSAIDIVATCTQNQATYTLAVNQSAEETAITWDTGSYMETGSPALLTEQYTLLIYDAESSISATPKAGYLGQAQFIFAMYSEQPYVDRDDWQCTTCTSGALTQAERQSLMVVIGTAAITVMSFTWFAAGFGLL